MAARIDAFDWGATPLGPRERWDETLRTLVALMLAAQQPMFLIWGAQRVWLNNDAFLPILGRKHPDALGRDALDVWGEARETLAPLFARVLDGEAVRMDDIELMLDRHGRLEEAHFAFSYTPARDARGHVAGLFGVCIETTANVLAERREVALKARQLRLFEQAPGFIAILHGPQHVFEFVNEAYVRLAGGRDLIGLRVADAFPEIAEQGWLERLDRVYATGERFVAHQVPVQLRDPGAAHASDRHLDFIYEPIVEADGSITGIFVEGHDVSEAHAAQSALRANERRTALLVELGDRFRDLDDPDDISFAAAELLGRALGVSRAGYGTIDRDAETITIERDWNAPGTTSLAGVLQFRDYGSYIEDLKRGETVVFADARTDPRTRDSAGALEAIHARAVVNMPVTEHRGFVALLYLNHADAREWTSDELALVRDVAERTRTAVERRRAEQELRALAESLERQVAERTRELERVWTNSRDLLVVVGADGVFRAANPAWITILGHAPASVVGRNFRDFVWPEDLDRTEHALEQAATSHDLTAFENRYRHADGTPRWISWHTAAEGDVVYAYGRDVTAQKEQSRALEQAENALRQSQKLEAMGQLTGGVAHDFNNLLGVISNNLFLHRRLSAGCADNPQLAAIARAIDTGARLTRQLLAFSRRQALRPEVLDLARELEELQPVLQVSLGSSVRVRVNADAGAPPVRVDRSELELAIINMAMNARDAMPDGGAFELSLRPARDGELASGAGAVLVVRDSGHGIPPELLQRVLEPFFSTKGPGRGTGLGLSQVYGFATQAGGRMELASEPGVSTTITLFLPASSDPVAQDEAADETGSHKLSARLLLVEDNVDVGSTTRELLQYAGCDVLHLTNGEQALAFLASREPGAVDLVLSDLVMPGEVSGVALALWMRRERPDLPVLLATGHSAELRAAKEHGFTVLQKPVDPDTLIAAVRDALAAVKPRAKRSGRTPRS
ncbi:MAG TPA: PAS domain-containing protein [Xanthomonadales bacterium]|nr:PAS domain-containing protein [Xanthomonadales bacterium]